MGLVDRILARGRLRINLTFDYLILERAYLFISNYLRTQPGRLSYIEKSKSNLLKGLISSRARQLGDEAVIRILALFLLDGNDLAPSGPETVWSGWQVVLDRFAERREIVERHSGEHVVLHMILHVPIEEADKAVAGECAATEPEIRRIGHHAKMLGHPAEHPKPTAVERKGDQ